MAGKKIFIYLITNTINGKKYIGRTCSDINKRLNQHFCDSKYILNNCPLHKDMKLFTKNDFIIEILYEFYADNIYDADSIELEFINKYNTFYPNGYNKRKVIRNGK